MVMSIVNPRGGTSLREAQRSQDPGPNMRDSSDQSKFARPKLKLILWRSAFTPRTSTSFTVPLIPGL